ncbi:MAG: helix-turn-helix domain-containing protein [Arenimonas sp.]|jgi:DNA-binding transcriptional ArsR family regulator
MKKLAKTPDVAYTTVESAAQIRALTSPLRQDIIDLAQAMVRVSVPELADHLGRPADALYYHVRALQRAGLLVEAGVRRRGRHDETLYSTPDPERRLKLRYRSGRGAATKPLRTLVASMLRNSRREFDSAISDPGCVVEGSTRELWAGRATGWLTQAELAKVNRLIAQLGQLLSSPHGGRRDRLYSLQFLLSPSAPARKSASTRAKQPRNRP